VKNNWLFDQPRAYRRSVDGAVLYGHGAVAKRLASEQRCQVNSISMQSLNNRPRSATVQFLGESVSARWFIAILFGLTLLKLLIVPAFYDYDFPVHEIGFGFGPATQAVATTGSTKVCPPMFMELAKLPCTFAERMPLIPYVFAGAMKVVGDNALRVAILKTAMLDLLLLCFLSRWLAMVGADRFTLILVAVVFVGPQYMVHSFSPEYEEGFLIQLLPMVLIIQFAYLWSRENVLAAWARLPAYVSVNAAIYLVKSSMILVSAWNVVFLATAMKLRPALGFTAACAMALPLVLWGSYVKQMSGQFAFGTSIDGWNLFLGNNPAALNFYPRYSLDAVVGDGSIELDGRPIERYSNSFFQQQLEQEPSMNEWRVNDVYRNAAMAWAIDHIEQELTLIARRLEVFFLEIRNNPIVPGHEPSTAASIAGAAWMIAMRVVLWIAIVTAALAMWRGTNMRTASVCFLALVVVYAAPLVLAYAYERHVVPIILPAALFVASAWRLRGAVEPVIPGSQCQQER
jgi:hypothetical protein